VVLPIWFLEQLVSIPMESGSGVAVTAHAAGFAYGVLFVLGLKLFRVEKRLNPVATKPGGVPDTEDLRGALDEARFRESAPEIDVAAARLAMAFESSKDGRAMRELIIELNPTESVLPLPKFVALAAAFAERTGDRPLAISLYEHLCRSEAASPAVVPALVRLAMLRKSKGDVSGARDALGRALAHPACSPEWRRRIDNTLSMI
jgi:hypothetical protein